MSIKKKIVALVAVLVLFMTFTASGYHLLVGRVRDMATANTTEMLLQDYRNELKDLVDAMAPTLAAAAQGAKDEAETYRVFTGLVKNARFFPDHSGYYFIYKTGGTVFVLPTVPDLEGKNIIGKVDSKGTEFIRKLDQVAQGGGGYVEYWFDKPGQGVLPKLSYARMIPGTNYWMGTGVYIDDVEGRKAKILGDIHDANGAFLWRLDPGRRERLPRARDPARRVPGHVDHQVLCSSPRSRRATARDGSTSRSRAGRFPTRLEPARALARRAPP